LVYHSFHKIIFGVINGTFSASYVASRGKMIMNDELERT